MSEQVHVRVLRSVPVSDDGVHSRDIIAGTDDTVPAELLDGLVAEEYVEEAAPPSVSAPAPDPDRTPLEARQASRGKWYLHRGDERIEGPFSSRAAAEERRAVVEGEQ